jgi:hypothetical protein
MEAAAPEGNYVSTAATGKNTNGERVISVAATANRVQLVDKGDNGTCYVLTDTATGSSAGTVGPTTATSCTAA